MTETEHELWRLVEVSKAISAPLELDQILSVITDGVLSILNADNALVILLDDHRRPTIRIERTSSGEPTGKYSHSVTEKVLTSGEPIFVLDTDLAQAMQTASVQTLHLRTVVCAPLRTRDTIAGVLYAHSTNPIHAFTESKKRLFLALCDFASIAINHASLYAASISDPMSRLYNHSYCQRRLDEELARSQRYHRSLAFLLLDIDHFKAINDGHGHRRGDDVIHAVADVLRTSTRKIDIVARYGGDEFAVIMPETGEVTGTPDGDLRHTCTVVGERIRTRIDNLGLEGLHVTGSIGIATYPVGGNDRLTYSELIEQADRALYEAKRLGRNRVCVASEPHG